MQRRAAVLLALLSALALAVSSNAMAATKAKTTLTKGTLVSEKAGTLTVKAGKAKDTFVITKTTKCDEGKTATKCANLDAKSLVGKSITVTWTKSGTKDDATLVTVTK